MVRCPVCGTRLDFAESNLSPQHKAIRAVIESLHRENGRWPYAREIGDVMGYSDREIRRELVQMEKAGIVQRFGARSGWILKAENITVIHAA